VGTALRLSVPTLDSGGGPSICRACPYFRRLGRHVMICYGPLIELGMWSLLSNSHFGVPLSSILGNTGLREVSFYGDQRIARNSQ
jgi:hypothetical protein